MSDYSVASLKRVSAKTLSEKILEEQDKAEPSFAVIDVRDVGMFNAQDFSSLLQFTMRCRHFLEMLKHDVAWELYLMPRCCLYIKTRY
jgi:hypothetical protein